MGSENHVCRKQSSVKFPNCEIIDKLSTDYST